MNNQHLTKQTGLTSKPHLSSCISITTKSSHSKHCFALYLAVGRLQWFYNCIHNAVTLDAET